MHFSQIKISNFRNFSDLDVPLSGNVVAVGEKHVGKIARNTGERRLRDGLGQQWAGTAMS